MNLHSIVQNAIGAVNPQTSATLTMSNGYTTGADGSQIETYAAPVTQIIDVQQLYTDELNHVASLNLQGNMRKVWMNGQYNGVVRPKGQGGDLLTFNGQNWLITLVLEQWADWTSVVVTLQQ